LGKPDVEGLGDAIGPQFKKQTWATQVDTHKFCYSWVHDWNPSQAVEKRSGEMSQ
jgi:hypothetical protein